MTSSRELRWTILLGAALWLGGCSPNVPLTTKIDPSFRYNPPSSSKVATATLTGTNITGSDGRSYSVMPRLIDGWGVEVPSVQAGTVQTDLVPIAVGSHTVDVICWGNSASGYGRLRLDAQPAHNYVLHCEYNRGFFFGSTVTLWVEDAAVPGNRLSSVSGPVSGGAGAGPVIVFIPHAH